MADTPLTAQEYARFAEDVYAIVATVPYGKVASYGQIAEMVGRPKEGREVGTIMSRAPSHLPCHRIVNRTGALAPDYVFGGQQRQQQMLEEEGITFTSDGRIDMVMHQWQEEEQLTF